MRAKLTGRNRLTLPKAALLTVGAAEHWEVEAQCGRIVLTPVRAPVATRCAPGWLI